MDSIRKGFVRYYWVRILGIYGIGFVAIFLFEFVLNRKAMPFGDNFSRSILIATGWSLVFACWDAFFGRIMNRLGSDKPDAER